MGSERALLNLGVERGRINRPGVFQDKRALWGRHAVRDVGPGRPGAVRQGPSAACGRAIRNRKRAALGLPNAIDGGRVFASKRSPQIKSPLCAAGRRKAGAGWSGADSNRRHTAFQAVALPPELPDLKTHTNVPVPAALVNDRSGCFIPPSTGIGRVGQRWTARDQSAPPNGARPTSVSSAGCGKSVGRGV